VSNTNVHLLAGLGRAARVLVPYPAEWRWMRRDGASPSPDWSLALEQLRRDLHV
jgi:hypothetical protein